MFIVRLISALKKAQVDYAVVGGFAVAFHGATRGTVDVDLVIHLKENDFKIAEKTFYDLGLESRLPVDAKQVFQFREEYINKRNLLAWNFYNPIKPIESVDILLTETLSKITIKKIRAFGITIQVASIEDLIRMKMISARPQDLSDIDALKALQKKNK